MKQRLKEILLKKSVITGQTFRLASGKTSDFYVDARMTTLDPEGAYLCAKLFLDMLEDLDVEAVGGYAIGADPIVASIAVLSHLEQKPLPAFIIRKEEKAHGTRKTIEGNLPAQARVALIDDVITSGGSILKGAKEVEAMGGKVTAVLAVIDRQEGGGQAIENAGYRFLSIFKKSDLI